MAINIIRATDPIEVDTVVLMIYGRPGSGKTTLACSSHAPLLLDFDKGSHRSGFRGDSVRVQAWQDVAGLNVEDLQPYQTIVVDTVGKCIDAMIGEVRRNNPKHVSSVGPTMQGWQALGTMFSTWIARLREFNKDVVLISQEKEQKGRGDDILIRPAIKGQSYDIVWQEADAVGYMASVNNQPVLHFSLNDAYITKATGGLEDMQRPDASKDPQALGRVLDMLKANLGGLSAASAETAKEVDAWSKAVEKIKSVKAANEMLDKVVGMPEGPAKTQAKSILWARIQELAYVFKDGRFAKGGDA